MLLFEMLYRWNMEPLPTLAVRLRRVGNFPNHATPPSPGQGKPLDSKLITNK